MKILDLILGKKKTFSDPIFGKIVSQRIKKEKPDKQYTWHVKHKIPNTKKGCQIILEGNFKQPNYAQLEELKSVFMNLTDLQHKMDVEIKKINQNIASDQKLMEKNWQNKYYFSAVFPLNGQKPEFEFCFAPYDDESSKFIHFKYRKGEIQNMTF